MPAAHLLTVAAMTAFAAALMHPILRRQHDADIHPTHHAQAARPRLDLSALAQAIHETRPLRALPLASPSPPAEGAHQRPVARSGSTHHVP